MAFTQSKTSAPTEKISEDNERPARMLIEDVTETKTQDRQKANHLVIEDVTLNNGTGPSGGGIIEDVTESNKKSGVVTQDATTFSDTAENLLIEDVPSEDPNKPLIQRIYEENARIAETNPAEKNVGVSGTDGPDTGKSQVFLGELDKMAESSFRKTGVIDFSEVTEEEEEMKGLSDAEKILKLTEKVGSTETAPFDPDLEGLD